MAITFTKDLSTTNFLNAYNNNVVEFSSDSVTDSKKCTITIGSLTFDITPINNVFTFNFKHIISVLINSNNFNDEVTPALALADDTSHIYDDTSNTYLSQLVSYEITFINDTTESTSKTYKFLKSVEQLEQYFKGVITGGNDFYALTPFRQATANTYDVTYFEGYPFDIGFLMNTTGATTILNQTNALSYSFNFNYNVTRLFFSDGRITITLDDYLPLVEGLNELKITRGTDIIFVNLTKVESKEGQYVKWLNNYGEWNYWLFNCIYKRTNNVKDIGFVDTDFDNVSETNTPLMSLGKESVHTLTLVSEDVNELDQEVLNGILDSPIVYYFTGLRLSQVSDNSWLSVKVKNTSDIITNFKRKEKKYKIDLELPQKYTMKL